MEPEAQASGRVKDYPWGRIQSYIGGTISVSDCQDLLDFCVVANAEVTS